MDVQTLRKKIRDFISKNKTEDAFELLSNIQFNKVDKELIVLSSQYNRIKEELRLNVISKDEGERKINQINMALLDISNKLDVSKASATAYEAATAYHNVPPQKQSFDTKWLLLLFIPITAFLVYWGMGGNNSSSTQGTDDIEIPPTHNNEPIIENPENPNLTIDGPTRKNPPPSERVTATATETEREDPPHKQDVNDLIINNPPIKDPETVKPDVEPVKPKPVLKPFRPDLSAIYYIKSKAANRFLDVHGAGTKPGTNLTLYGGESASKGHYNQVFKFVNAGGGYYYIESTLKDNLTVDISNWGTRDGTNAQLTNRVGGTSAQKFKLYTDEKGYVKIVSALGLNLSLGVTDQRNNVVLRSGDQGDHLLFKLYKGERVKEVLSWKPKGSKGAVVGGREAGKDLVVCRCDYKGSKQPGKVNVGMCHFGWGGKEIYLKEFEVLTNPGNVIEKWAAVRGDKVPAGAVVAGYENGRPVYVGRAKKNGVYHPGKVFLAEGDYICNFGYGGKEIVEKVNYEILVSNL